MERAPRLGRHLAPPALLGRGFRIFFLLAGIHGCVFPLLWIAVLSGWLAPPTWLDPLAWHAHEMVFGFVVAAISGFLLTSVPVWTQRAPVVGPRLAALAGLWLAGRAAMLGAGSLSPAWVALLDLPLLLGLLLAVTPPILASRQRRNYGFPLVLVVLLGANVLTHAESMGQGAPSARLGLRAAVYAATLLVVVIGGRIVPTFTANALRRAGREPRVRSLPGVERWAVPALLCAALADLLGAPRPLAGALALAAAALLALRMVGWQSLRTLRDPLLWSLHLGSAWIPVGLAGLALADLGFGLPPSLGIHALTAGAIGTMILAVMSRVALGHTGRPLVAPRPVVLAYLLVTLAALLRTAGAALWPERALPLLQLSGIVWSGAFAIFTLVYAPILAAPRIDGQPG